MMKLSLALAVATLGLVAVSVDAKKPEPVSLQATSKWIVNFDADRCTLARNFGVGDEQVALQIVQYQPEDKFNLRLFGKAFSSSGGTKDIFLSFGQDVRPIQVNAMMGIAGTIPMLMVHNWRLDNRLRVNEEPLPSVTPEQEAAAQSLNVRFFRYFSRLEMGSLAAVMRTMRECTANLITSWGYDPIEQATLSRVVAPVQSKTPWISDEDYPRGPLNNNENGIVFYRLDVDETGVPTSCHILEPIKPEGFDKISCQLLMKKAKFIPALNQSGKPVKTYFVGTVRFVV